MEMDVVDHRVLDKIHAILRSDTSVRVTRESECVEMFDLRDNQWYEIVVRPIDAPEPMDVDDEGQARGRMSPRRPVPVAQSKDVRYLTEPFREGS